MKNGLKHITAGTLLFILYSVLGYIRTKQFQWPGYIVNYVIETSLQDGNIFAIIFWFGAYALAFASIFIGIKHIAKSVYKYCIK